MNPDSPLEPDHYQQAWQAQASQKRVTVDANVLFKEVRRTQRNFLAVIFRRDLVEVGVGLLLLPYWFYAGITRSLPWTWYLTVPALIWIVAFILVDRRSHKQTRSVPGDPLLDCVQESLAQVEHQIWLLRNVFWWYLLPPTISILAFFAHTTWLSSEDWLAAVGRGLFFILLFVLYASIYYLNQRAVRSQLEPRRQELLALLASLGDETISGPSAEMNGAEGAKTAGMFRHPIAILALLVTLGFLGSIVAVIVCPAVQYARRAPFTGVRWEGEQPVVKIGGEWFKLVSLDELSAPEIVAFSRRTYGDRWRKRFEEDLVEVLSGMGHAPNDTVRLVVMPLGSQETRTLESVPMTRANRRAIWDAARARERSEREQPTRSSVHTADAEAPLTKLVVGLRKKQDLVGLAAMVMVDGHVVASAVDGERKIGSGRWLEIGDRWHLGGISKNITATMIARLVQSGQMQWSDTVGKSFSEASVHEDWKPVTLKQLLNDTAGTPVNFSANVASKRPALGPECTQARREAVLEVIAAKTASPPGEKRVYSSVGYTIAGAMAEKATGATWEDLLKREVFEPLELTGAGFGPPQSPDETLPQPRGHRTLGGWKVAAADDEDNTPIIGPAATVHMTLGDLCTYATEHLRGESGEGKLVSAETYKLLHTPELDHRACGWIKKEPGRRIPYTVYWHNGTNTLWYALVAFIPEQNMVVAVTSNDGDFAKAEAAAWEIVTTSVKPNGVAAEAPAGETPERAD